MSQDIDKVHPPVFVAVIDGDTWQEQYLKADKSWTDYLGGRHSDAAGVFDATDLPAGAAVLIQYETPTGMRYAKSVNGATDGVFLVTLAQDGGGNGGTTNGTKPTWTYTMKSYEDGTTILKKADGTNATGMSPIAATRLPLQAAAATVGTACRKNDGTLVLVQAFEDYGYEGCT